MRIPGPTNPRYVEKILFNFLNPSFIPLGIATGLAPFGTAVGLVILPLGRPVWNTFVILICRGDILIPQSKQSKHVRRPARASVEREFFCSAVQPGLECSKCPTSRALSTCQGPGERATAMTIFKAHQTCPTGAVKLWLSRMNGAVLLADNDKI